MLRSEPKITKQYAWTHLFVMVTGVVEGARLIESNQQVVGEQHQVVDDSETDE